MSKYIVRRMDFKFKIWKQENDVWKFEKEIWISRPIWSLASDFLVKVFQENSKPFIYDTENLEAYFWRTPENVIELLRLLEKIPEKRRHELLIVFDSIDFFKRLQENKVDEVVEKLREYLVLKKVIE